MRIRKALLSNLALSVTVIGLSAPSYPAFAQKVGYACDGKPTIFVPAVKNRAKKFAKNHAQIRYFYKLVEIWDAAYIREGCEVLSRGGNYDDSCLHGRRPLEQIAEDIPDGFYGLSQEDSLKLLARIQKNTDHKDAYAFCRAKGFYRRTGS